MDLMSQTAEYQIHEIGEFNSKYLNWYPTEKKQRKEQDIWDSEKRSNIM